MVARVLKGSCEETVRRSSLSGYCYIAMWLQRCPETFLSVAAVCGCYSVLDGCQDIAMRF